MELTAKTSQYHVSSTGTIHTLNASKCGSLSIGSNVGLIVGPADEASLVAEHGSNCCSHCFPTAEAIAPVAPVAKPGECPAANGWTDVNGSSGRKRVRRFARCNDCGNMTSLTSTDKMRKHKG